METIKFTYLGYPCNGVGVTNNEAVGKTLFLRIGCCLQTQLKCCF